MDERRSWLLRVRQVSAAVTLTALPLAAAGALAWATDGLLRAGRAPGPVAVDRLVALGAAAACGLMLAAAALGAALTVLAALAGRVRRRSESGSAPLAPRRTVLGCANGMARLADSVTPGLVRRLAGVALGVSLVGVTAGQAGAAWATPRAPQQATLAAAVPGAVAGADAHVVSGAMLAPGWSLDRPATPRRTSTARPGDVVVRPGDTLWDIAARALGDRASPREVATAWPRWHRANRRTIGADPDLLMPGQQLRPPPALDRSPTNATPSDPATR